MRILYIYRNPQMGISIGKVFSTIETAMSRLCEVDSIYLPSANYKPLSLWKNIRFAIKQSKTKKYDIIHITSTEHYLLPFLRSQKTVITVHDLGFYTRRGFSISLIGKYLLWIRTIKFATKVTFISESSRNEAIHIIKFKENQCSVIYNPIGEDFRFNARKVNITQPVILHIGTPLNKNLENTIIALKDTQYKLRIIGKLSQKQLELLDKYKIDYSNAYNLTNNQIIEEYNRCDIVNFPSFYEGFGMPIIEGQSIGRVVITSNLSPMKEIANESAVLVEPNNVESILEGYKEALNNYSFYIEKGLNNVQRFQIRKIVEQYYQVYKTITQ